MAQKGFLESNITCLAFYIQPACEIKLSQLKNEDLISQLSLKDFHINRQGRSECIALGHNEA